MDAEQPLTFSAYARLRGFSQPYVSRRVAEGVIAPPALTPERKIIPSLADAQLAAARDPAYKQQRATPQPAIDALPSSEDVTFARERTRKMKADAERAEIEVQVRKGELIDRRIITETLAPRLRQLRDDLLAVPHEAVRDPADAARAEAAIVARLDHFVATLEAQVTQEPPAHDRGAAAAAA